MKGFKHLERIDAYMEGSLSEVEQQRFEADLIVDESLRTEFEACQAADKAAELIAFRGMMERIRADETPGTMTSPKRNYYWWIIGGVVFLALLLLGWLIFAPQKKQSVPEQSPMIMDSIPAMATPEIPRKGNLPPSLPEDNLKKVEKAEQQQFIAQANSLYEPIKFTTTRGDGVLLSDSAAIAYDSAKYQLAVKLASSIKHGEQDYQQARKILAHAYFNLKEYEKAASVFQMIVAASGDAGKQEQGMLLLSWLAAGKSKSPEFKALLIEIQKDKFHPFYEKSLTIK